MEGLNDESLGIEIAEENGDSRFDGVAVIADWRQDSSYMTAAGCA